MKKWNRGWDILFLNFIKIKWHTWVSYSFTAALDYNLLYKSMHFWCHDTTLKRISSIEELNLTWNKQANFKKLGPLSTDFQTALRGRRDGKFALGNFSIGWWESGKEWF